MQEDIETNMSIQEAKEALTEAQAALSLRLATMAIDSRGHANAAGTFRALVESEREDDR